MSKIFFFLLLLVNLTAKAQNPKTLDSIVQHFDKANLFHGSVLVAKNGKIVLEKSYGYGDAASKKENTTNTLYQIGSVTKQFTAATILKLEEQGKLSVNDTISNYFPELKWGHKITVHHLLTHTSGLFNFTNDTTLWLHESKQPISKKDLIAKFSQKPLDFEPGTKYNYSNSGYVLLGFLIEKISGKPYEKVIRDIIFQPSGMQNSGFNFSTTSSEHKATGYYDNGTANMPAFIVDSTVSYAAGAIYSTTGDLYKWTHAIHNKKILTGANWQKAFTPFLNNYAYGFVIDTVYGNKRIWHNGGIHGFVSHLEYFPSENSVVILLSNYMQSNLMKVSSALTAALYNKPYQLPEIRKEIKVAETILQKYIGEYQLAPNFIIAVTFQNGGLIAQATGQPSFQMYSSTENRFFLKVVEAEVEFMTNDKGAVSALILYQNGRELKGQKIK